MISFFFQPLLDPVRCRKIQGKPEALAVLARSVCPRGLTQPLGLKGPPALLLFGFTFTFLPLAGAFPVSFFGTAHCSPDDGGVAKMGEMYSRLVLLFEEENHSPRHLIFLDHLVIAFAK